jgi:hypothetical protein
MPPFWPKYFADPLFPTNQELVNFVLGGWRGGGGTELSFPEIPDEVSVSNFKRVSKIAKVSISCAMSAVCLSVLPFVRWTKFHKISHLRIFRKSVEKISFIKL